MIESCRCYEVIVPWRAGARGIPCAMSEVRQASLGITAMFPRLLAACGALLFLVVIVIFKNVNDKAIIDKLFTIAGYTYGPLLGFFTFGLFTKWQVKDKWVPMVAVLSPVICYVLSSYSKELMNGYKFGFELIILNGALTFAGLYAIRRSKIL